MALFPYKAAMQLSLLCATCTLFAAQSPVQEARFLKRMKEYWKEGDYETAKKQIVAYLEQEPDSSLQEEMHLLLGDLFLKEGNFVSALEEYDKLNKEDLQEKVYYNKVLCYYEMDSVNKLLVVGKEFSAQAGLSVEQRNSIRYLCASSIYEHFISSEQESPNSLDLARELFESCAGTSFEELSLYPLARLYEKASDPKQAASYFEAAAKFHPEQSIQFLFQSAVLRSDIAPELAISTFEKLYTTENPKQSEALYNSLLLQYKTKNYKDFVSTYEKHYPLLNQDYDETITHLLGKSLYQLGEYDKALEPLTKTLDTSKDPSIQKASQLMILECAYKKLNVDLYQRMFRNPSYPLVNDENYNKAHLVYLNLLKASEYYPQFVEEGKLFIVQNPNHPDKEQVLWDIAYFLYQDSNWKEASSFLSKFIQEFPSSKSAANAWRLQLNCSLFELQQSPTSEISKCRNALIENIKHILPQSEILSAHEKENFSFELVKNLFLEEQFKDALIACKYHLEKVPETRFLDELELLQTLCYLSAQEYQNLFIEHAQALLNKKPNFSEASKLRLHLFNAYLQKAQAVTTEEKDFFFDQAADQLFLVFEKGESSLKDENIQWLAEHYYQLASKCQNDPVSPLALKNKCVNRSVCVFETLLPQGDPVIQEETEAVLLRLSSLLDWSNQQEKRVNLLTKFLSESSSKHTPIQKQLALELAQTHGKLGNSLKALDLYNELIQNFPSSSIRALAILDRSRLLRSYLPDDQKNEGNDTYAQNLNDLKDLEVQRSLLSEPLHLEAGLEYINWKASSPGSEQSQTEKRIKLLKLFKENFAAEHSAEGSDSLDPKVSEKEDVLASYLKFADVEILRLEASLLDQIDEASHLERAALVKMQELMEKSLPEPLKHRILICQKDMEPSL